MASDNLKLINIGFGSMVSAGRVLAVISPESAPVRRIIQESREAGTLIDATFGRRTRAVLIMDSGHVILSGLQTETVAGRMTGRGDRQSEREERDE
ncbi:MAG: DUF370 domain-containing protein [Oscillospiraceae bacterium]|nr:DUF370 domain-containing protein [Oscillospiraceae bacterium]